jgi:hypothetical protein
MAHESSRRPPKRSCRTAPQWLCVRRAGNGPRTCGEVAEWLKAPHSKCGILARVSGVRIPPSPPQFEGLKYPFIFSSLRMSTEGECPTIVSQEAVLWQRKAWWGRHFFSVICIADISWLRPMSPEPRSNRIGREDAHLDLGDGSREVAHPSLPTRAHRRCTAQTTRAQCSQGALPYGLFLALPTLQLGHR